MSAPIPLEEAWVRLLALAPPAAPETIPADDATGRWLAHTLAALRTQPARDLSAMDGFAVAGPGPWSITGESRAGRPFDGALETGQAVRISTGAACPPGSDAILIVENAEVHDDVLFARDTPNDAHIRRRGFDFAQGDDLLPAGARIGPAQIALARAAGHGELVVARRPRLAIIECGDELVADPHDAGEDRLPASNGAMVAAMASALVEGLERIGPIADDRAALVRALAGTEAEVIVTTAGASVGEHDHVKGALEDWGASFDFWRVAIRPGKPLLVASRGTPIVLGLPGNPASAFVTAYLFLLPLLRAMQGACDAAPRSMPLPLAGALPGGDSRREFRRARFANGHAEPLDERDSSALRTLAAADLLIDRPAHAAPAAAGDIVQTYWIGNGGTA